MKHLTEEDLSHLFDTPMFHAIGEVADQLGFHCYAVGVNMVGTDGIQMDYNGHSVAYDTWLKDIAGFEDYEAGTRIVDFSIEKLRHFREVLPQWQEADEYTIKNGD